jgi:hypothetical protein
MATRMKMTALWDKSPCSLLEADQHFRASYCLHHQDNNEDSMHLWNIGLLQQDYNTTSHKAVTFIGMQYITEYQQSDFDFM